MSAAFRKVAFGEGEGSDMASPMANTTEPTNYLQAELEGRQAQEMNESTFYRQQTQEAQAAAQQAQQQAQEGQQQLQQLQMQADSSNQQIQQALGQAMQAQDEALQKSQVAANMRIGMQKLRGQLMDIASPGPGSDGGARNAAACRPGTARS